jgi:UDP-N-acetylmuramoylalanine--D-glutamate ligase
MNFAGQRVLVLGAGISGIAVAGVLQAKGAQVILNDAKSAETLSKDFTGLIAAGVTLALGQQDESLLRQVDCVVLSPGISIEIPLVKAAQQQGISVISEIEVAYSLCPAPIAAITGTNGKTTTTTLIGEMLRTADREVVVGGNIGTALSQEVSEINSQGYVVAEISSFQLEAVREFRPHISAILNITPDHLDRHHTMENYIAMKERIFANQTQKDYLLLNYDEPIVRKLAAHSPARVVFFSRTVSLPEGVFVDDGKIVIAYQGRTYSICALDCIQLRGAHNIENVLAACGVAFFAEVSPCQMAKVLQEFTGVEHRIEPVDTINGVIYYNDSKATNPESSIKALEAFDGHVILIAGGRDKNTDLAEFMALAQKKADHLILLGEAKIRFGEAAASQGVKEIHYVADMAEAVDLAHRLAVVPQIVLLSPACSSYDMFKNYEERGKIFKRLVKSLLENPAGAKY